MPDLPMSLFAFDLDTTGQRQSMLRLKRWTKDRLCRNMSYK
jgi:hypothetical protein